MNNKIIALLLIASIGGGFMGLAIVMSEIFRINTFKFGHLLIFGSALVLFCYFVYAGVCFAVDKSNIKHLKISFLLQTPWILSPIISYKIAAGISLSGLLHLNGFNFSYNIGSDFNLALFGGQSWGLGLNFAALGLYYLATKTENHLTSRSA